MLDSAHLGLAPGLHRTLESSFHLAQAGAEELAAIGQARRAHVEVSPERADLGRPLVQVVLGRCHRPCLLSRVGFLCGQQWQREVELGDTGLLASEPLGQLVGVPAQGVRLGGGIAMVGVDALEPIGGGRQTTVVLVELAGQRTLGLAGLVEERAGSAQAGLGVVGQVGRGGGPLLSLFERGTRGTGGRRARPANRWCRSVHRLV